MATKTKIIEDVGVIKVKGALMGGDETDEVHEAVKRMVAEDVKKIVLDFHRVRWMNSHGIGMLMGCYSSVQTVNGRMALTGISDKVRMIMEMTKVNKLFDEFETLHQAVKALI